MDIYTPDEIAERVERFGAVKANMPVLSMMTLGIMAGVFIGFGAMFYTLIAVLAGTNLFLAKVIGGLVFSIGLIFVVIAGAELFTGNNLLVMAWASGRISLWSLLKNWVIIFTYNSIGAMSLAICAYIASGLYTGSLSLSKEADVITGIAQAKVSLPFLQAFMKGVLCNALVCFAIWLAMAGRSLTDKVIAIVFPVTLFVAAGFEHSIANMYFIPYAILLTAGDTITWTGLFNNLLPVTLGNIVGGSLLVALVYYIIYRRK